MVCRSNLSSFKVRAYRWDFVYKFHFDKLISLAVLLFLILFVSASAGVSRIFGKVEMFVRLSKK